MVKNDKKKHLTEESLSKDGKYNNYLLEQVESEYHTHAFYEIFYIVSGSPKQRLNDTYKQLQPYDCYLLRPDIDAHKFIKGAPFFCRNVLISKEEFKRHCDFLSPSLFERIQATETCSFRLSPETMSHIEYLFKNMPFDDNEYYYNEIIVSLLRQYHYTVAYSELTSYQWIKILTNMLAAPEHFSLSAHEIIAKHLNYNFSYVCKTFKQQYGRTLTDFFNEQKLEYSKILLTATDLSVGNVAEKCGFNTLAHFLHIFKDKYGITPLSYRKNVFANTGKPKKK